MRYINYVKLYIDDVRPTPVGFDLRAYTSNEAILLINKHNIDFISFDHDLGGDDTAYKVALFIEERSSEGIKPTEYAIHSANPVGAKRIEQAMESANRIYNRVT